MTVSPFDMDGDMHGDMDGDMDGLFDFSFEDLPVRGALVRLRDTWSRVIEGHRYPSNVAQLLGEMLGGAALLSHLVKDTDVALQARGDGPLRLVMAESLMHRTGLRGIARLREDTAEAMAAAMPVSALAPALAPFVDAEVAPIETLLGKGDLAITLRPSTPAARSTRNAEMHQGIVPLEGTSLSGCIEHYFATSEQLPTRLWLTAAGGIAAGLLLQRIPSNPQQSEMSESMAAQYWSELLILAGTLTAGELRNMPVDRLLLNLFHEHRVRLRPPQKLGFHCTCSRDKTEAVLRLLGKDEVDTLLASRGEVDMQCQFCGTNYVFSDSQADALWVQ